MYVYIVIYSTYDRYLELSIQVPMSDNPSAVARAATTSQTSPCKEKQSKTTIDMDMGGFGGFFFAVLVHKGQRFNPSHRVR